MKVKPTQRKNFLKWAETLEYKVFGIPKPDLILFLYVPLVFAQILIAKKSKDQYEKDVVYLKKVETMYLEIVKTNKSWVKIDCVENNKILPPEMIHQKILDKLSLS